MINKDRIKIVSDYTILHFDEYPILFVGANQMEQMLVGSFVFEENNELHFFYSIVDNQLFSSFLSQKISYLELLQKANEIFFVTTDFNENIKISKKVVFNKIDKSWLPLENSFCPSFDDTKKILLKIENAIVSKIIGSSLNFDTVKTTPQSRAVTV